ncbi:MAG: adenylate/guanylate cyclase domain-containing protein [Actinomycetota bacterium]|nr:adenylate/guanylate cyclase domain-containing protein [Actinomycetota bacterium]
MSEEDPLDPRQVVDLLEEQLLGAPPSLTGLDVAGRVGIPIEVARERWRSLGFTAVEDDEVAFTDADVRALELTQQLHDFGLVDPDSESALIRTLGRSFARLSEWQLGLLGRAVDISKVDREELNTVTSEITPVIEQLMNYVWRRHTLSAASRMLLAPSSEDEPPSMAVGFADIVGYTRRSRSLTQEELARVVEEFESRALEIITAHRGRIIKTIGDEVLFAADAPDEAASIALELVESHRDDADFPQLRVGLAWGEVLSRLGDVFGPVVNVAARLTSTAKPGRVLVDRSLADALADDAGFRLRRMRRTSVKGYRRLEPWSLKRPRDQNAAEAEKLPGPDSRFVRQHGQDLVRAVDEVHAPRGRTPSDKRTE